MDEGQILGLVQAVLGAVTLRAVRMTDGQQSEVWEVALPERLVIVRLHADPHHFSSTQHNLEVLTGLGLPVPRVLATDLTCTRFPLAYLILTRLPGRDLRHELGAMTDAQVTRLAERIASFQTTVGRLPRGTGYGYVGIGGRGPHGSWWDVLGCGGDASRSEGRSDALGGLWARVFGLVEANEPYLRSVPPTCFLDDITVKNVLVRGGELQGLVDFDCVCYGDPLYWLGLTAVGGVSDVGLQELFYVSELCRFLGLGETQRRVFLLYASWIALGFVDRFAAGETREWLGRMLAAIEGWVAELERGGASLHADVRGMDRDSA